MVAPIGEEALHESFCRLLSYRGDQSAHQLLALDLGDRHLGFHSSNEGEPLISVHGIDAGSDSFT